MHIAWEIGCSLLFSTCSAHTSEPAVHLLGWPGTSTNWQTPCRAIVSHRMSLLSHLCRSRRQAKQARPRLRPQSCPRPSPLARARAKPRQQARPGRLHHSRPCWSGQQRRVPSQRLPQLLGTCQSWGLMKLCLLHACRSTSSMFGLLYCISAVHYHCFHMLAYLQRCCVVLDAPKALRRAACLAPTLLLGPRWALPHRQPHQALPHQLATPKLSHRC